MLTVLQAIRPFRLPALFAATTLLSAGCGGTLDPSTFLAAAGVKTEGKVRCNDSDGFNVCLTKSSSISDATLKQTIVDALSKLHTLVAQDDFKTKLKAKYSDGDKIVDTLSKTNYLVTVTAYCSSASRVLANAVVDGNTINYNSCTVKKDSSGNPDLNEVAGVLLHEISHNMGYTHAAVNPSPDSVPYYVGDLATATLEGKDVSSSGTDTDHTWDSEWSDGSTGSTTAASSADTVTSNPTPTDDSSTATSGTARRSRRGGFSGRP